VFFCASPSLDAPSLSDPIAKSIETLQGHFHPVSQPGDMNSIFVADVRCARLIGGTPVARDGLNVAD
jgi:hypothetical protein